MAFVVTAVATAVEVGTVAAIATAVSEVGIAMSVVGAVTGNKELVKIGGVLSIAGGVGGLAASFAAGATDAAAGAAADSSLAVQGDSVNALESGAASSAAADAATNSVQADSVNAIENGATSSAAPASSIAPDLTTPQVSATPTADTSLTPTMSSAAPSSSFDSSLGAQSPSGPAGAQAPQGPQGALAPSSPADDLTVQGDSSNALNARMTGSVYGSGSTSSSPGSLFDGFQSWVKNNPKLAEIGMQAIGGTLKGMSDYSLQQQKLAQEQQRINLSSYGNTVGMYSPTAPVNPNPGIIGGARG